MKEKVFSLKTVTQPHRICTQIYFSVIIFRGTINDDISRSFSRWFYYYKHVFGFFVFNYDIVSGCTT